MIKKLLVFLALVGVGFFALHQLTKDAALPQLGQKRLDAAPDVERRPPGVVVPTRDDKNELGPEMTLSVEGPLRFTQTRDVPLADGTTALLPIYRLEAAQSRPLTGGRHELTKMTIEFFESDASDPARTTAAARLEAAQAEIVVGVDRKGRQSVATDKDALLRDAVLRTGPEARVRNLELRMARALVRATDTALLLRTVDDNDSFTLRVDDRGEFRLGGRGLRARLPARSDKAPPDPTDRISLEVGSAAELMHESDRGPVLLRSRGPFTYLENPASGLAIVAAIGGVEVEGSLPGAAGAATRFTASGERLDAELRRGGAAGTGGGDSSATAVWRSLRLSGQPTRLRALDADIVCAAVQFAPGIDGSPYLITAHGSPTVSYAMADGRMNFSSSERLHVVLLREHLAPWLAPLGYATAAFPGQMRWLMLFEGRSEVDVVRPDGPLTLRASRGLRVLRGRDDMPVTVCGFGEVRIDGTTPQGELLVTGNDGFTLHRDSSGQRLRLGPLATDPAHHFEVRTNELHAVGNGACRVRQHSGDDRLTEITLVSRDGDLTLTATGAGGTLERVESFDGAFDRRGVQRMDARGAHCHSTFSTADGSVVADAERVWRDATGAVHLYGTPAIASSEQGRLEGDHIVAVDFGPLGVWLEANGRASLAAAIAADSAAARPMAFSVHAETVAIVPFLWPALANLLPDSATILAPFGERHLVARGGVEARLGTDTDQPASARGDLLVLRAAKDAPAGQLVGTPATFTRTDPATGTTHGSAALLRFAKRDDGEYIAMVPGADSWPTLRLDAAAANARGPQHTSITCRGTVTVQPRLVQTFGPVEVRETDANGIADPTGLHVTAAGLRLRRSNADGAIESLFAYGGVEMLWRSIHAQSQTIEVDVIRHLCRAADPGAGARVRMPGIDVRCALAVFDYVSYECEAWQTLLLADHSSR